MLETDKLPPNVTYIIYYYSEEDDLAELRKLAEPPEPAPQTYTTT